MAFTDSEVRALKRMTRIGDWPISGKALIPLLSRLKAAEKVIHVLGSDPLSREVGKAYSAWLKSAGKSEEVKRD